MLNPTDRRHATAPSARFSAGAGQAMLSLAILVAVASTGCAPTAAPATPASEPCLDSPDTVFIALGPPPRPRASGPSSWRRSSRTCAP